MKTSFILAFLCLTQLTLTEFIIQPTFQGKKPLLKTKNNQIVNIDELFKFQGNFWDKSLISSTEKGQGVTNIKIIDRMVQLESIQLDKKTFMADSSLDYHSIITLNEKTSTTVQIYYKFKLVYTINLDNSCQRAELFNSFNLEETDWVYLSMSCSEGKEENKFIKLYRLGIEEEVFLADLDIQHNYSSGAKFISLPGQKFLYGKMGSDTKTQEYFLFNLSGKLGVLDGKVSPEHQILIQNGKFLMNLGEEKLTFLAKNMSAEITKLPIPGTETLQYLVQIITNEDKLELYLFSFTSDAKFTSEKIEIDSKFFQVKNTGLIICDSKSASYDSKTTLLELTCCYENGKGTNTQTDFTDYSEISNYKLTANLSTKQVTDLTKRDTISLPDDLKVKNVSKTKSGFIALVQILGKNWGILVMDPFASRPQQKATILPLSRLLRDKLIESDSRSELSKLSSSYFFTFSKNSDDQKVMSLKNDEKLLIQSYRMDDLKLNIQNPNDFMFQSVSLQFLPYEDKSIVLRKFFVYEHFLVKNNIMEFWIIIVIAAIFASIIGWIGIRLIKKTGNAPDNVTIFSTTKGPRTKNHRFGADSILVEDISLTTGTHFPRNSRGRAKGARGGGYRKQSGSLDDFD